MEQLPELGLIFFYYVNIDSSCYNKENCMQDIIQCSVVVVLGYLLVCFLHHRYFISSSSHLDIYCMLACLFWQSRSIAKYLYIHILYITMCN